MTPHSLTSRGSRQTALYLGVASAAVLACGLLTGAAAPASQGKVEGADEAVDVASAARGVFQTTDGARITVQSEYGDLGERSITGITPDGTPAQVHIQSSAVSNEDRLRVAEAMSAVPAPESLQYTEEHPGAESGTITAEPLSQDPADWEIVSVIGYTDSTASFSWSENPEFAVYQDGQHIGDSDAGQFVARGLERGATYSFSLVETSPSARGTDARESAASRMITFETFAGEPDVDLDRVVSPLTYQPYYNQYGHKTFIPDLKVGGIQCHLNDPFNNWEFGGDFQSYQYPALNTPYDAPNYRTMMFANVNWDNPSPYDIAWTKNVGATPVYRNGALDRTLYAGMDAMTFHDAQAGSSYAKIRFQHFAGNPGCAILDFNYSGAITYGELVEFYRSGTIAVDGSRFRAPAHEMYGGFTNSSGSQTIWKTIARLPNEGFICLLGTAFCPPEFYDRSASY